MSKVQTRKPAPVAEAPEGEIEVGSRVVFQGYPDGTPEADMQLTEGVDYEVLQLPEGEGDDAIGFILQAPNPDYNPRKAKHADNNPEFLEVEVFGEEIQLLIADGDGSGEGDLTYEELAGYDKAGLLEIALADGIKLTVAQKKTQETLLEAIAAALGLEPAAEGEGDITYEELADYSKEALVEFAKDNEIKLTVVQKKTQESLLAAVTAALGLEPAGDDAGAAEGEGDITYEELAGYSKDELLAFAKDNEVKLTVPQKKTAETLLAALAAEFGLEPTPTDEPDPVTYEELAALDKAGLLAFAKDNEVTLTVAQKKTQETLLAALCAAYEVSAPVLKPAAKPAAKADAKAGKAATGKGAAGKAATTPAKPAETDDDALPDLEGEDEQVLALVAESTDLVALAQELEGDVASTEYKLGGILFHIKKNGEYKELDASYAEHGGWALFVQENFNVDYRKAQYLIEIYVNFTQAGIANPSEVLASIGWTKASKIAKHLSTEGADVLGLIEAAESNTVADLSAFVKENFTVGGTGGTPGTVKTKLTLRFRYTEEQAAIVEDVLNVAGEQLGTSGEDALFHILSEWAVANNVETVAASEEATGKTSGKAATKPAAKTATRPAARATARA